MADIQTTLRLNDQASNVLQKVANTAKQVSSQMQATGNAIDRAFTSSAPSSFASQAGNAIQSVEGQAASLGMAVDRIFEEPNTSGFLAEAEAGFGSASAGAEELAGAAETAGNAIDEAASAAEGLGNSTDGMGDNNGLDELGNDARGAGAEMDSASEKAFSLGEAVKKMALAIGAVKIANGFKNFVQESIGLGTEYTHMMAEVAAISGATGDEYAMLQQTARDYGASTIFTATESAEALKYMSLAGWSAQQSAEGLPGVLNLAAASGMELGAASDMVTDYLTAFGMEAGQATYMADMLSYAQSNSNTTAQQLGEAYLNSAAAMHSAGQDIETTTAMMEAMANQGTKGSRAGTQMAAIVRDITQKMETYSTAADLAKASSSGLSSVTGDMNDLLGTSAIQIGNMLVPVSDAKGNFRDLTDIMTDVETSLTGLGTAEASAALMNTFTDRSVRGVRQILTEGMENVAEYEERLRHSAGAAQDASDKMNDNLAGDTAMMTSAFQEMRLQVFEGLEGTLRGGTQYLTNTVIPILTDWVPDAAGTIAGGISRVGQALAPMLETVLRNPQAVATAFSSIGTGLAAFGAVNRISSVMSAFDAGKLSGAGGLIGAISKFGGVLTAHPWAAGAAAVVGAITAVGLAWKHYNDQQIEENLAERFGKIELTASQIGELADMTVNADWKLNVDSSLANFQEAGKLAEQARQALISNDSIEWKARIGLDLSANDIETYKSNIQEYVTSSIKAIEDQSYAMSLSLETMDIRMVDGSSFADKVNEWAAGDVAEAQGLSDQLTQVVQNALEDGIMSVDEQEAINRLQDKMNNILAGWKLAESKARMDMIEDEFGRLSGRDLTVDSFTSLIEKSREARQEAMSAADENRAALYSTLEAAAQREENRNDSRWDTSEAAREEYEAARARGEKTENEYWNARHQIAAAAVNEEAGILASTLELSNNTLDDKYGDQIAKSTASTESAIQRQLANMDSAFKSGNTDNMFNIGEMIGNATAGRNAEMGKLWKTLQPDVQDAKTLMDQYSNLGEQAPQSFYDSYWHAMEVGAAAGDSGAAMELAAKQLVGDESKQALRDAILDGTANVPQDFKEAVERAAVTASEDPPTFEGVRGKIESMEVEFDEANVQRILADTVQGISATGQQVEVDGGEVVAEYEITTKPITAGELAEKLGTSVDEAFANQPDITTDTELQVGTKFAVSATGITVETGNAGVAVEEARAQVAAEAEGAASDPIEVEQAVNTTTVAGETDTSATQEAVELAAADPVDQTVPVNAKYEIASTDASQLGEAVSSALQTQEAAEITIPANVTITAGTVVAEEALSAAQSAITSSFGSTFEAAGQVNVTLTKASDNIDAVYNQVGSEINSKFSHDYHTTANLHVSIHVDYSIANPTKTVTFSGAGSGSGTIHAHALGGYFDEPHIGLVAEAGAEYIIPMNGSNRSIEMWRDAGEMLGVNLQDYFGRAVANGSNPFEEPYVIPHADGGIFDEPHLGLVAEAGPEAAIPLDGSDRSLGLWEQAGAALGALPRPQLPAGFGAGGFTAPGQASLPAASQAPSGSNEKTININIGGNGTLRVTGGSVDKEAVVEMMMDNFKDVFMQIVEQEIVEEGEGVYVY